MTQAARFTPCAGQVLELVGNRLVVRDLVDMEASVMRWTRLARWYRPNDAGLAAVYERDARALAEVCDTARAYFREPIPGHVEAMLAASVADLNPEPRPAA